MDMLEFQDKLTWAISRYKAYAMAVEGSRTIDAKEANSLAVLASDTADMFDHLVSQLETMRHCLIKTAKPNAV